jgi:hypothetical protein
MSPEELGKAGLGELGQAAGVATESPKGYELDLGIGIAKGFATIGAIGFEGRWDFTYADGEPG